MRPAVEAIDLVKHFGETKAVDGVSFAVPEGTVLGLLGPNGAGKTTTVRMLTTLSRPTSGTGRVAGHDIVREPEAVRRSMGLTGQAATVDELLTGRENIRLIGRLYGLPARLHRQGVWRRAARAVLADRRGRPGREDVLRRHATSPRPGRQPRRRVHRCCSSTSRPRASTRAAAPSCGTCCASLVRDGTTLLLTTQYLEEADQLADEIVVDRPGSGDRVGHRRWSSRTRPVRPASCSRVTHAERPGAGRGSCCARCSPEVHVEPTARRLTAQAVGLGDMTRIAAAVRRQRHRRRRPRAEAPEPRRRVPAPDRASGRGVRAGRRRPGTREPEEALR